MNLALIALSSTLLSAPQDFSDVANRKEFFSKVTLTAQHRAALAKNQFFTSPTTLMDIHSAYGTNDYLALPSLLTADNVLQIYHIFFDSTLRTIEETRCIKDLEVLTEAMVKASTKEYQDCKGTKLESAATKNLAYFAVARTLLGKSVSLPTSIETLKDAEVRQVGDHKGFLDSKIFPYKLDYSQFIVRGHYTKSNELRRYFLSMMWLGLVPVAVAKRDRNVVTPLPEQIRMASLMAMNLKDSGAEAQWNKIYDFTSLYAGLSNRLTPKEWRAILAKTYPRGNARAGLADDSTLATLAKNAIAARPPAYQTMVNEATVASDVQMRFMGQRALPDGYMAAQIIEPEMRPFPNPLDFMAILGSNRAGNILDANPKIVNPKGWQPYKSRRERTKNYFASLREADWSRDLYWSWLDSLRKATTPMTSASPSVFQSSAWQDRRLNSALASWAELRHDTILYGEQVVAEMGDGDEPQPVLRGYIEPDVALYIRLSKMIGQLKSGLQKHDYLIDGYAEEFQTFDELLDFFITVSKKELAGQKLSREAHDRIRKIEGVLGYLNTKIQLTGTKYTMLTENDLDMALVADVHTANQMALTVAVGRADEVVAIVPIEGKKYFTRGTVFSYHEWLQPISARMTDEEWKKILKNGGTRPRPFWTNSFFVNKPVVLKQ